MTLLQVGLAFPDVNRSLPEKILTETLVQPLRFLYFVVNCDGQRFATLIVVSFFVNHAFAEF